MSIIFRFAERGDGGAIASTRSGPAIDRENNRFRLKFIPPNGYIVFCSNFPAIRGITSASWLPAGALDRLCLPIVARTPAATSWTQTAPSGVRVKRAFKPEAIMVEKLSAEARKSAL